MLTNTRKLIDEHKERLARTKEINQASLMNTIREEEREENQKRPRKDIISASNSAAELTKQLRELTIAAEGEIDSSAKRRAISETRNRPATHIGEEPIGDKSEDASATEVPTENTEEGPPYRDNSESDAQWPLIK